MPETAALELAVTLHADEEPERLDQQTRQLVERVRELGVDSAERVRGDGPPAAGAKGVDLAQLGELAVKLAPAVLPLVLEAFKGWLARGQGRTVTIGTITVQQGDRRIEVDLGGQAMTADELDAFIDRLNAKLSAQGAAPVTTH